MLDRMFSSFALPHLLPPSLVARWILASFATFLQLHAHAQTELTLPPFSPIVTVNPLVAEPGVPRTITLNATWNDGCPPGNPEVIPNTLPTVQGITIRLHVPQTLVACAQVLTPYTVNVTYTPASAGIQRIAIVLNDGRFLGSGQIVTHGTGSPRSTNDLTGVWYDPATNGSGLALFHSQATTDVMAGSWYAFEGSGKPFWYLIQNGRWISSTVYQGSLVELQALGTPCNQLLAACARPQNQSRVVANIAIQVLATDRVRITVTPAGEVTPAVILADFEAIRLRF